MHADKGLDERGSQLHAMQPLPLLATALIADWVAGLVSCERLYHGLSQAFMQRPPAPTSARDDRDP